MQVLVSSLPFEGLTHDQVTDAIHLFDKGPQLGRPAQDRQNDRHQQAYA